MDLFDSITIFDFDPFSRRDKKMEKLMREGEVATGTLYAVKYREKAEDVDEMVWGFDLNTINGPLRASVRQYLPWDSRIRLGHDLKLRHLDGRIGVDWAATTNDGEPDKASLPGKTLKDTLAPGIDDNRINAKRIAQWDPAIATVTGTRASEVMGMATQNIDIELEADGRSFLKKRENVPAYCIYLLEQDSPQLPVALDPKKPDKLIIDWKRAAEQDAA